MGNKQGLYMVQIFFCLQANCLLLHNLNIVERWWSFSKGCRKTKIWRCAWQIKTLGIGRYIEPTTVPGDYCAWNTRLWPQGYFCYFFISKASGREENEDERFATYLIYISWTFINKNIYSCRLEDYYTQTRVLDCWL